MNPVHLSNRFEQGVASAPRRLAVAPGEAVWVAALPCVLVGVAAVALLGPALGRLLPQPHGATFWGYYVKTEGVLPEPTEHARYLIAITAPLLLLAATALLVRRGRGPAGSRAWHALATASRVLVPGVLVLGIVAQHQRDFGVIRAYFTPVTLAFAFAFALLAAGVLRRPAVVARARALARETTPRRALGAAIAVAFTVDSLLVGLNTEGSAAFINHGVHVSLPFWLDETFAVLDGRSPLVNFVPQYGHLTAYATAGVMAVLGTSVGVYTVLMTGASVACLLCVYALLHRVVRSWLAALALYLPFVATSFFMEIGPPANRYSPANLFSEFPMRYGGPYVLAWLTARRVDGLGPRLRPALFLVAGLVAINNVEFGLPAVGATVVAELVAGGTLTLRRVARLAADVVVGLAAAAALVSILTLVRAGSLPHFGLLFRFSRIYGVDGFGMLPMMTLGFYLVLYATFVAALVLAVVRRIARDPDVLLTAMLAWAGVFGLGTGSYFVGRSHPEVLIDLFSVWALALALLVVVVVRAVRAPAPRAHRLVELAVLAAFGLAICSLAQTPTPWSQIARVERTAPEPVLKRPRTEEFVGRLTHRGEPVALLVRLGHRIAYDLGLKNISPYASLDSMPTTQQLAETIRILRAAGGRMLFTDYERTFDETIAWIRQHGFVPAGLEPGGVLAFADRRGPVR